MADKIKKLDVTKQEAEKAILRMQDVVMKIAQYKGLDDYQVKELLTNFAMVKRATKNCVEYALNYPTRIYDEPETKPDGTKIVRLNLNSGKTYKF